jgi:hypothetical protein
VEWVWKKSTSVPQPWLCPSSIVRIDLSTLGAEWFLIFPTALPMGVTWQCGESVSQFVMGHLTCEWENFSCAYPIVTKLGDPKKPIDFGGQGHWSELCKILVSPISSSVLVQLLPNLIFVLGILTPKSWLITGINRSKVKVTITDFVKTLWVHFTFKRENFSCACPIVNKLGMYVGCTDPRSLLILGAKVKVIGTDFVKTLQA